MLMLVCVCMGWLEEMRLQNLEEMIQNATVKYSNPSLINPPYLPRNCDHIREMAFVEWEKYMYTFDSSRGKDLWPF